ncbi:NUDIX hydrolase [Thalassobium sp. R2A62]|uniref:NUDIX hydrolase n=1 Tax=Thalassobium sp. R2A62 TaxID=633131 RepID=UPI0001B1CB4B|nr:hydrolase, nudix family [Thalassobium sp. R2A62]
MRDRATEPRILMGQRGANAAFMPNKFVFPGGAVDVADAEIPLTNSVSPHQAACLAVETEMPLVHALQVAAIRELSEETGLMLGSPVTWDNPPEGWENFAAAGICPDAAALSFVFRAVTPQGRPRRFDARFFLVDADHIHGDLDDFSNAEDELSHLQWVPLGDARGLNLPFITQVVLAEVIDTLDKPGTRTSVPFFRNDDERHLVDQLSGRHPLAND